MEKEYRFAVKKCSCGFSLSGKRAELAGMKGSVPMGYCPKCAIPYRLVEIESEPVEPEPSAPEPEPEE